MRILHVITSLRTGGAEHLMVDLLPRLRDLGDEVELLLFDGTRTPFYEQLESTGIPVHYLTIGGSVYNPMNIFRMAKYMRRFDIVHTHNTACQLFAPIAKLLAFSKARLFTTEHSSNNRRRGNKLLSVLDRWMYNRYERIICISDKTQENLENHIGKHTSIVTIYNGVDTQKFAQPIKDISGQKEVLITMVASLSEAKDQDTLIRAIALLPDCCKLQLVGDGPRRSQLEGFAKELKVSERVSFLGIRSDIPELLERSDVMVLSSHWEGLSLSSVEGMASGRPFIASDVDGLREVVKDCGMMFPEGDAQALAKCISELYEHPELYCTVAHRCQKRALEFDISLMAQNYHKCYANTH